MKILKKYRVKIYEILNKFIFINNFSISYYFSRFGNNLQQVAIGLLYSQKTGSNFYVRNHNLIQDFSVINNPFLNYFSFMKQKHRFFYFDKQSDVPKNILNYEFVVDNIESIFKNQILPNLDFLTDEGSFEDSLIIHIRSGDIFNIPINSYYQNPINYYEKLIQEYENVIVVTSEEKNNPVIESLLKNKKVKLQSSSLKNDFNFLYNAVNLATSGVGTFPIAAALFSKKLKNLHYTNLFLEEHLNPKMIINKNVKHHIYKVEEGYIEKYRRLENFSELILSKNIAVSKLQN